MKWCEAEGGVKILHANLQEEGLTCNVIADQKDQLMGLCDLCSDPIQHSESLAFYVVLTFKLLHYSTTLQFGEGVSAERCLTRLNRWSKGSSSSHSSIRRAREMPVLLVDEFLVVMDASGQHTWPLTTSAAAEGCC